MLSLRHHRLPRHRWHLHRAPTSPLSDVPPFDRYTPRALAPLTPYVDWVRPRPGTVLATEGWMVREVLVVLAGEVQAVRQGRRLHRFGPGERIGAAELLCGARHLATLVAGDDLEVVVVNGPAYRWAARTLPALDTSTGLAAAGTTAVVAGPAAA
jgi:CRP-like cAMP-binding protein